MPSMNYANMIEEKRLKKTFIIATLISTIIGTFTTGMSLYERVSDKRAQKRTDHSQDEKIKALEKRVDEAESQRQQHPRNEEDLRLSLRGSGPMIRREYDQDYARMGPRFAEGDLIAQTQLQGQVITLQSTVIKLLEDALVTGRPPDINRLYNASEFARDGSIRALKDQYARLMQAAPLRRPLGPVRHISSTPALKGGGAADDGRLVLRGASAFDQPGPLFCRYSEELQDTDMPLDEVFDDTDGPAVCPVCAVIIPVEQGRSWKVDKEVIREMVSKGRDYNEIVEIAEDRTYRITNRFIVKCHRDGAGYACYLCYRYRDKDTLCKTVESLVDHVSQKHNIKDYESDSDITHRNK